MSLYAQPTISLYSLSSCTFGTKDAQPEKYANTEQMLIQLQERYKEQGLQRHVQAVILVHLHGHPHVLLLQSPNETFKLPGGWLQPGENEAEGLKARLADQLSPQAATLATEWVIGDCIAAYWRPHFEPQMYPYLPVHVTRPKESRKLFAVHLPERCYFAVPKNYKLVAIPLYDCYEGTSKFGAVIATLPHLLSRYRMTTIDSDSNQAQTK